jgi:2-dehydro-3-deoxyphosphogluconate aldolase / (4S)-4-hydroxy-2-oxoglutarate aldolase
MHSFSTIQQQLKHQFVLPLFYHSHWETCLAITKTLYDAGIRIIEFTNRGPLALPIFTQLVNERNKQFPGLLLAAGTIKTLADAENFTKAGADFLISPFFQHDIALFTQQNKIVWVPGCMTPTEIAVAETHQCKLIKLFPGSVVRSSYLTAIQPIFPDVQVIVTGGVENTEASITEWLQAGAFAVGMGSHLLKPAIIEANNFDLLKNLTEQLLETVATCKKQVHAS